MIQRIITHVLAFFAGVLGLAILQVVQDNREDNTQYDGEPDDELTIDYALVYNFDPERMNAILLSTHNVDKIMATSPEILRSTLFDVIDEYGEGAFVFVPFWRDLNEEDFGDWAIVPVKTFTQHIEILDGCEWLEASENFVPVQPKPFSSHVPVEDVELPPLTDFTEHRAP